MPKRVRPPRFLLYTLLAIAAFLVGNAVVRWQQQGRATGDEVIQALPAPLLP